MEGTLFIPTSSSRGEKKGKNAFATCRVLMRCHCDFLNFKLKQVELKLTVSLSSFKVHH